MFESYKTLRKVNSSHNSRIILYLRRSEYPILCAILLCYTIGGSYVPFCPLSPVKGKEGQDKKGQNGHKNTKNG